MWWLLFGVHQDLGKSLALQKVDAFIFTKCYTFFVCRINLQGLVSLRILGFYFLSPYECPRPSWAGLGTSCSSERCPWIKMSIKVHLNPNHSIIPWCRANNSPSCEVQVVSLLCQRNSQWSSRLLILVCLSVHNGSNLREPEAEIKNLISFLKHFYPSTLEIWTEIF